MKKQIQAIHPMDMIDLVYTLFPKTKRLTDTSNVCCIHDKFFCDALVEFGKLKDDNYLFVKSATYKFGEVDKHNPRVEITIKEHLCK